MASKQKTVEPNNSYFEYLQKNDAGHELGDCLLKLIENKPNQPMLFMAEYFDSCTDKSNKVANAFRMLACTQKYPNVFEANLLKAYNVLSSKSCGSKKTAKPGLMGSVFEPFLLLILSNNYEEAKSLFLKKIMCRSSEVVPFDVFRYCVHACFLFNEYMLECKKLYELFANKQATASSGRAFGDIILDTYKSALSNLVDQDENVLQYLNATLQLSPRTLAFDLINLKENKHNYPIFSEKEFLLELTKIFLGNIKSLN